jgi:hypothetical protein
MVVEPTNSIVLGIGRLHFPTRMCAVLGRGQGQAAADAAGDGDGGHRPRGVHSEAEPVPRRGEQDLRGTQHLCWPGTGVHQERTHCFVEKCPGRMPLLFLDCKALRSSVAARPAARRPDSRVHVSKQHI